MIGSETELLLSEFHDLRELLYRETGISFEVSKHEYLGRRVRERIVASAAPSFRDYLHRLRTEESRAELQQLINLVTVNESYFFREEYQLRCLVRSILAEVAPRRAGSLRLWSIPCANGEEPYSLAIYLLEHWPQVDAYDIQILASDIDTQALRRAEQGLYSARAVEQLPRPYLQKYFRPVDGGQFQICPELRRSVEFTRLNLSDPAQVARYRDMDVIFCRNLLIYFDDESRLSAANALYQALSPGGFVCLGHSETMSRISSAFVLRRFPDAIVYQRPGDDRGRP